MMELMLISERFSYLSHLMWLSAQDFTEDSNFFQNWQIYTRLQSITSLKDFLSYGSWKDISHLFFCSPV